MRSRTRRYSCFNRRASIVSLNTAEDRSPSRTLRLTPVTGTNNTSLRNRLGHQNYFRQFSQMFNVYDIGPIITPDNTTLTTDYEKACSFNDYFTSVGRPDIGTIPSCSSRTDICLDATEVNAANVMAAIKN